MDAIKQIEEKREALFQELKDEIEATNAEDFKYYEVISDFREILGKFESLREEHLDILARKVK